MQEIVMLILMSLILMARSAQSLPRIIRVGAIFTEDQKVGHNIRNIPYK